MAALAASLSRPVEDRRNDDRAAGQPTEREPAEASPTPAPSAPVALSLVASENEAVRLPAGEAATLEVTVNQPGSVEIPGLGLSTSADHLTPARFDLLTNQPGRYELLFTPAGAEAAEAAGRLVVTSSG
jgi:hypothetical protein